MHSRKSSPISVEILASVGGNFRFRIRLSAPWGAILVLVSAVISKLG